MRRRVRRVRPSVASFDLKQPSMHRQSTICRLQRARESITSRFSEFCVCINHFWSPLPLSQREVPSQNWADDSSRQSLSPQVSHRPDIAESPSLTTTAATAFHIKRLLQSAIDRSTSYRSSTVILDYASSLLANALNRHYYFVLLGAAKNIDG